MYASKTGQLLLCYKEKDCRLTIAAEVENWHGEGCYSFVSASLSGYRDCKGCYAWGTVISMSRLTVFISKISLVLSKCDDRFFIQPLFAQLRSKEKRSLV